MAEEQKYHNLKSIKAKNAATAEIDIVKELAKDPNITDEMKSEILNKVKGLISFVETHKKNPPSNT